MYSAFCLFVPTTVSIEALHSSKLEVSSPIISRILLNSFDVFSDNSRILEATTENPRPLSPALAASILAFSLSGKQYLG